MDDKMKAIVAGRNAGKGNSGSHPRPNGLPKLAGGLPAQSATYSAQDGQQSVRTLRLSLQRELELARQIRAEAEKYRRETGTKARSEAQRLMLETRLELKKEISQLESEASQQLKKVFINIRMIHLMAQEELEAQRQFTSAAKINALSHSSQGETEKTPQRKKPRKKSLKGRSA